MYIHTQITDVYDCCCSHCSYANLTQEQAGARAC